MFTNTKTAWEKSLIVVLKYGDIFVLPGHQHRVLYHFNQPDFNIVFHQYIYESIHIKIGLDLQHLSVPQADILNTSSK